MKVLSLLQPWASLVVLGHKKIETRSWNTKYRGELLIHASMGKKKEGISLFNESKSSFLYNSEFGGIAFNDLPFGAIIGKVNLIATIPTESVLKSEGYRIDDENGKMLHDWKFSNKERAFGDYSLNRFGWLLSDPILFKEPIPCKGQLLIWNVPKELHRAVNHKIQLS